jgi:hypothetical protein
MLDTEEAIERQNEIAVVLSQSIANEQIDESEIEAGESATMMSCVRVCVRAGVAWTRRRAELDALEAEELADMPSVPTDKLPSTATASTASSSTRTAEKKSEKVAVMAQ